MKNRLILSDVDGVCLQWENAFHEWMTDRGYSKVVQGTYNLSMAYNIHQDNKHDVVSEFNNSSRMLGLSPFRDAKSGIAKLNEHGYKFRFITSLSDDRYSKKARQINLEETFGNDVIDDLVCLKTAGDKDQALEPYRNTNMWWIEDLPKNCEAGLKVGLRPILITHDHNRDYHNPDVIRVDTWKEICDLILKEENNVNIA